MVLIFILVLLWGVWYARRYETTVTQNITGAQWTFYFKSKRTPPLTVNAPTLGLAVKQLMRQGVDYQAIASVTP